VIGALEQRINLHPELAGTYGYRPSRLASTTPQRATTPPHRGPGGRGRAPDGRPRSTPTGPRSRRHASRGPRVTGGNDISRRTSHPRRIDGRRGPRRSPGVGTLHAGGGPAEEPGRPVPVRSRAATDLGRRLGVRSHRDRPAGTPAARRGHRLGSCVAARDAHRRRRSLRGQHRRSTVTIINARPAEDIDEPVSSEPSTRPVGRTQGRRPRRVGNRPAGRGDRTRRRGPGASRRGRPRRGNRGRAHPGVQHRRRARRRTRGGRGGGGCTGNQPR
jgi:hypothetical protein